MNLCEVFAETVTYLCLNLTVLLEYYSLNFGDSFFY